MRLNKKVLLLIIIALTFLMGCTSSKTDVEDNGNKYISKHDFEITYLENWHLESNIEDYKELDLAIQEHHNNFYIFSSNPEVGLPGDATNKDLKIVAHIFDDIPKDIDQWIYDEDGFFDGMEILAVYEVDVEYGIAKEVILEYYSIEKDNIVKQRVIYYKDGNRGAVFIAYPYDSMLLENFYQIVKSFKFN